MTKKYLPVVTDYEPVKAILRRTAEILEAEGNRGDMWGYGAIVRAVEELGYKTAGLEHKTAATLFVNANNSAQIKVLAIQKVLRDLG